MRTNTGTHIQTLAHVVSASSGSASAPSLTIPLANVTNWLTSPIESIIYSSNRTRLSGSGARHNLVSYDKQYSYPTNYNITCSADNKSFQGQGWNGGCHYGDTQTHWDFGGISGQCSAIGKEYGAASVVATCNAGENSAASSQLPAQATGGAGNTSLAPSTTAGTFTGPGSVVSQLSSSWQSSTRNGALVSNYLQADLSVLLGVSNTSGYTFIGQIPTNLTSYQQMTFHNSSYIYGRYAVAEYGIPQIGKNSSTAYANVTDPTVIFAYGYFTVPAYKMEPFQQVASRMGMTIFETAAPYAISVPTIYSVNVFGYGSVDDVTRAANALLTTLTSNTYNPASNDNVDLSLIAPSYSKVNLPAVTTAAYSTLQTGLRGAVTLFNYREYVYGYNEYCYMYFKGNSSTIFGTIVCSLDGMDATSRTIAQAAVMAPSLHVQPINDQDGVINVLAYGSAAAVAADVNTLVRTVSKAEDEVYTAYYATDTSSSSSTVQGRMNKMAVRKADVHSLNRMDR